MSQNSKDEAYFQEDISSLPIPTIIHNIVIIVPI